MRNKSVEAELTRSNHADSSNSGRHVTIHCVMLSIAPLTKHNSIRTCYYRSLTDHHKTIPNPLSTHPGLKKVVGTDANCVPSTAERHRSRCRRSSDAWIDAEASLGPMKLSLGFNHKGRYANIGRTRPPTSRICPDFDSQLFGD